MPGGGIEWGEHPEAALLRELEEETGIADVEAIGVTEVYSHTYARSVERPYDSVHHVGIIYNVTVSFLDLRSCWVKREYRENRATPRDFGDSIINFFNILRIFS